MFSFLDPLLIHVHDLLDALQPAVPAWLTVVLFTLIVRAVLYPANRNMMRGTIARQRLAPQMAELREKYKDDPRAMAVAMQELHREAGVSMSPGCLTILVQIPIFGMVYRLFTAEKIAGQHNQLLDQTAFGVPLRGHLATVDGEHWWLFGVLIAITFLVSAYAAWQMRRHMAADRADNERLRARSSSGEAKEISEMEQQMQETMEQVMRIMPLMSFMTVLAVISLPLAAGLYLVTSSTWGVLERASLRRMRVRANEAHEAAEAARASDPVVVEGELVDRAPAEAQERPPAEEGPATTEEGPATEESPATEEGHGRDPR